MMSKKDYELLADAINEAREPFSGSLGGIDIHELEVIDLVVQVIARALQRDNPKFDYARFCVACGNPQYARKAGEPIQLA